MKIGHIFVHLFEIGGGETYLYNFTKYSNYTNILHVNSNYNNKTLYDFNLSIIKYNSYEELNKILLSNDYDLIIDHQLYWFDFNLSIVSFQNISINKIIRITHGVPIHYKDITKLNYYYSIELYNDIYSHNSWNNHIKIYNNIGVNIDNINNINFKINEFNKKCIDIKNNKINIAIIGRIDENKIPTSFLKSLFNHINKVEYNKYIFNFYGCIDDKYTFFIKTIKEFTHPNIKYNGIIDPNNIKEIYVKNDIIIHPSLNEAGATVILEGMAYGLPIIARRTIKDIGGIPNALNNGDYMCENDNQFFNKLLTINETNYGYISKMNYSKVTKYNNMETNLNILYDELNLINEINKINDIPNILHYIYGFEKQNEEFPFVYYLSILSNILINKPLKIYFHYQYLPYGKWWDMIKDKLSLNYINADNLYWNKKRIKNYAHKADKIRMEILYKYGGIYMDIDTITYKSYKELLNNEIVFGIQEENYGKEKTTLYCNAIILTKKNNSLIKEWMEEYHNKYDANNWCECSIHLLSKIINENKTNIKILNKDAFYNPSYNETEKIFRGNEDINENLITLHYWNSYSKKYYNEINDFNWMYNNNSLYSKLMNKIYNIHNISSCFT